jgi:hypothetical protein
MTTQRTMFDVESPAQSPDIPLAPVRGEASEPTVVGTVADEKTRCVRHRDAILALLREGSATNGELEAVGGNRFGARIHELRKDGHVIEIVHRNRDSGLTLYRLKEGM